MPTTGAGLRAWGLMQGLRSAGLNTDIAMPMDACAGKIITDPAFDAERNLFSRDRLTEFVRGRNPDVLVFQHWGLMRELKEATCPIALDLAGPHLLERHYWRGEDQADEDKAAFGTESELDLAEKINALQRADFVTCSGRMQRLYFMPFLSMAGYRMTENILPVIPFSVSPDLPESRPPLFIEMRFIYGGMFLPWQNPESTLTTLLNTFEERAQGMLEFFGGIHPSADVSRGRFDSLVARLSDHPHVRHYGIMPLDELCREYARGGVALDLMERNPERELAFTTRTVVYLSCGLPVIHNNFSELSDYIRDYNAGWTLDPRDRDGLKKLIHRIMDGDEDLTSKRENARRLVQTEFNWEKTIEPLAAFCSNPRHRRGKTGAMIAQANRALRIRDLEEEAEKAQSELLKIKGKLMFRLYNRAGLWKALVAPIIILILAPLCLLLALVMLAGNIGGGKKRKS